MSVTLHRNERSIVRSLIRYLKRAGWKLSRAYDGEEYLRIDNERAALEVFDSVDECVLFFMRPNQDKPGQVLLIMGNREDVIADYGGPSHFTTLVDKFLDTL